MVHPVGGIGVHISEPSPLKRVKKSRRVGETVNINDNELERARPRHLLENTADYNQGRNTAGCLSQEGRHQTDARIFIDLSHDVGLIGIQVVSLFAQGMPRRHVTYCRTAPAGRER
jgi:hypothetical protein